jgi:glycosyl transferase family 2/glycosyl hydrolase family 26
VAAEPSSLLPPERLELAAWRIGASRLASVIVLATGIFYLAWRPSTIDETGALGLAFYVVETLNFGLLVLTAFLLWRVRQRSAAPAPAGGSLDVFITVCGEPEALVEETLRAALAIAYPHRTYLLNDGRLAGKDSWRAIEELAARYDVPCLTRTTGARGKAGNLNHALSLTGGDFVAVLDADHQASRTFGDELLGYFADPKVSLVTTRQEFHGDRADLLGNREPVFYSWFQPAKDAADAAFSTGSGVVYRRTALASIGGFSEWSVGEDFHTSTRLHAKRWTSVYYPRAVTLGIAPRTGAALVKQRLIWATDSARVLFFDNPLRTSGLTTAQRLHHFHTGAYYVVAGTQLFFLVSPALWLIWQVPVMRPSSTEAYLAHSLPLAVATFLLITIWGGRRGIRTVQQELYLAPVHAIGVARAAAGVRHRGPVSEKVLQSRFSPLTVPQQLIAALLVAAIAVAFVRPAQGQAVAVAWAAFMAYSLLAFVITVSGRPTVDRAFRIGLRATILLLAALVILPLGDDVRPGSDADATAGSSGPPLTLVAPESGAYLGVFDPAVLESPDGLTAWNEEHGARARIVHWYQQWLGDGEHGFPADAAGMVAAEGAVPFITWEPLGDGSDAGAAGGRDTLKVIASGSYDDYIRSWARGAARYGRPVLVRTLHDMNGSWYPWAVGANAASPELFVAAWRHLHDLFVEEGAVNVGWVWSVYSFEAGPGEGIDLVYPGARYVDWVSMAAFNWDEADAGWHTADELFGETYDALSRLGKPVMISQIATVAEGGDAGAWVRDALGTFRARYPLVKAVVWYDARYSPDVDLRLTGPAGEAFRSEVEPLTYWSPEPAVVEAGK